MKQDSIIPQEIINQEGLNSILDFYRTMAIAEQQFADAVAFATGVNSPFLNVLFDLRQKKINSGELHEAAADFFAQHQVPWGWFITPADKNNDLTRHALVLVEESPAMYFDLSKELPAMKAESVTVQELNDNDDLSAWIKPIREGFQADDDDDSYRQLNAAIFPTANGRLRHFIANYKGELASAGTLFMSGNAVMLHNLATRTEFKKCGVGTTLTLHMMQEAKNSGFRHCFLDSSSAAFQLYQKIGFQVYSSTLIYSKT